MKALGLVVVAAFAVIGCGDPASNPDASGPSDGVVASGPYDLTLKLTGRLPTSGDPWPTTWFVVIRDRATDEIVFWERTETESSTFMRTVAGKLVAGHDYDVGIAGSYYLPCEDGKDIWFAEINSVQGPVTIDRVIEREAGRDLRGCDVIHVPVALPAGTYVNDDLIFGLAGNTVELVVSSTGRLYAKRAFVLCPTSGCEGSLTTFGPVCNNQIEILPEQTEFSFGNDIQGSAWLQGTATINQGAMRFDYQGTITAMTSSSGTVCCEEDFTATLVRTGPPAACP